MLTKFSKPGDTSNFTDYPDSDKLSPEVPKKDDPFLDWWLEWLKAEDNDLTAQYY
jgi:hypothetical protein